MSGAFFVAPQLLGDSFEVKNFGSATCLVCSVNAETAGPKLKTPPQLYHLTPEAADCVAYEPDIVVLGPFGKHDALSPIGWGDAKPRPSYNSPPTFTEDDWKLGLHDMSVFLTSKGAKLVLALPVPFPSGSTSHTGAKICLPGTIAIAEELGAGIADLYTPFAGKPDCFPDADHLTNEATDTMTHVVAAAVKHAVAPQPKL